MSNLFHWKKKFVALAWFEHKVEVLKNQFFANSFVNKSFKKPERETASESGIYSFLFFFDDLNERKWCE